MNDENWLKLIPESKCPVCGYTLNAIAEKDTEIPDMPKEDDITMCIECYTPLLFNKDLTIRLLNSMEHVALGDIVDEMTNQLIFAKLKYGRSS